MSQEQARKATTVTSHLVTKLLVVLSCRLGHTDACPDLLTLEEEVGCSRSGLVSAIDEARRLGLLVVEVGRYSLDDPRPNRYTVTEAGFERLDRLVRQVFATDPEQTSWGSTYVSTYVEDQVHTAHVLAWSVLGPLLANEALRPGSPLWHERAFGLPGLLLAWRLGPGVHSVDVPLVMATTGLSRRHALRKLKLWAAKTGTWLVATDDGGWIATIPEAEAAYETTPALAGSKAIANAEKKRQRLAQDARLAGVPHAERPGHLAMTEYLDQIRPAIKAQQAAREAAAAAERTPGWGYEPVLAADPAWKPLSEPSADEIAVYLAAHPTVPSPLAALMLRRSTDPVLDQRRVS